MAWELDNSMPVYIQLVEIIKQMIVSGQFAAGERLDSVRDLAQIAGVNPNTMQRALTELETQGLIYSVRTAGRFVTEDKELLKVTREDIAKKKIDSLFESLIKFGFTKDELSKIFEEKLLKMGGDDNE